MSTVYKTYVSDFKEAIGEARKKIAEAQTVDGGSLIIAILKQQGSHLFLPNARSRLHLWFCYTDAKRIALVDAEKSRREADQIVRQPSQTQSGKGGFVFGPLRSPTSEFDTK